MKSKAHSICAALAALAFACPVMAQDPHLLGITYDTEEPKLVRVVDASVKAAQEIKQEMANLGASEQRLKEVQIVIDKGIAKFRPYMTTKQAGMEDAQLRRIMMIGGALEEISQDADYLFETRRRKYCNYSFSSDGSTDAVSFERTEYTPKNGTGFGDASKYCRINREGPRF